MSNPWLNSSTLAAIITGLAGIFGTYLAVWLRQQTKKPKTATEIIFEQQERIIKNLLEQKKDSEELIDKLELSLEHIRQELWETKNLLLETKQKLAEASNKDLQWQAVLKEMKEKYSDETVDGVL